MQTNRDKARIQALLDQLFREVDDYFAKLDENRAW